MGVKILCVAVIDGNGKVWSLPPPARHHDVIRAIHKAGAPFVQDPKLQGFIESSGRFVGRIEGALVALASGQIEALKWPPNLYSEDLW